MSTRQAGAQSAIGRARLGHGERLMPAPKMRADQYLLVLVAACSAVDPVGAEELSAATGVIAKNCGLVPVFAMNCGLLVKGHRRATYLPTEKGRHVARAFKRSESEGLTALRDKWKGQWFARVVKDRCRYGPVSREGLVAKLMTAAGAEKERIKQAHILLDLMVAVGLVTVEESGELNWFEVSSHTATQPGPRGTDTPHDATPRNGVEEEPTPKNSAPETPETTPGDSDQEGHAGRAEGPERPASDIPRPRDEWTSTDREPQGTGADQDLLSLLLPPVLLADLTRLTSTEVLELHAHLTAITALTAKLRGHRVT
ncbi:hypothetical protein ACIQZN_25045 [Streptomyces sp. NPDC097595]|uniref:hypothetical protein n=1 Tax=Streptomyces sp. NPDC097595 TaxID=3366090 RepID=UPI00381E272E